MLSYIKQLFQFLRYCWGCLARALGIHLIPSKHKRKIHVAILSVIAWDIIHVGARLGDLGFLLLSLLVEAESAEDSIKDSANAHTIANDYIGEHK